MRFFLMVSDAMMLTIGLTGIVISVIAVLCGVIYLISDYTRVPFPFPEIIQTFDLSGKRTPSYDDYIDEWLISLNDPRQAVIEMNEAAIEEWENESREYLKKAKLWKKHKLETFTAMQETINASDYEIFKFVFTRSQTRYRQENYHRYSYKVICKFCVISVI